MLAGGLRKVQKQLESLPVHLQSEGSQKNGEGGGGFVPGTQQGIGKERGVQVNRLGRATLQGITEHNGVGDMFIPSTGYTVYGGNTA